jgi:hypothetical protein
MPPAPWCRTSPSRWRSIVAEGGGNPLFLRELGRAARRESTQLPATIVAAVEQELGDLLRHRHGGCSARPPSAATRSTTTSRRRHAG